MKDEEFRRQQWNDRFAPHIAPINSYVDELRGHGRGSVPYVAPLHGGVHARVLSILRDPGPRAAGEKGSGFLCIENDDATAEKVATLLDDVGLGPDVMLPWNAYPWYINRKPSSSELDAGVATLPRLLTLLPAVTVVLLQGVDADVAWQRWLRLEPSLRRQELHVIRCPHPSAQALFTPDPVERQARADRRTSAYQELATVLGREAD